MGSANHVVLIEDREGHTPHPSSKLSKASDKAGHTEDSVGHGNTAGTHVVHGENEGRAGEGEETTGMSVNNETDNWMRTRILTEDQGYRGPSVEGRCCEHRYGRGGQKQRCRRPRGGGHHRCCWSN